MELTLYEKEALQEALKKYIAILEEQSKSLKKTKHSSSATKKEIQRSLAKKITLLTTVLGKL